ncbi:MAG: hypothetical protein R2713_12900 [Ilumatobacteraceae bacterium]
MSVLFSTHAAYLEHLAGPRHPERPERLQAVLSGIRRHASADALIPLEPIAAARTDLERVHPKAYLDRIEHICDAGGGRLDPDTYASPGTWRAAALAAGAGLTAAEALRRGEGDAAFCAVRPPGHHANQTESMGFCLISNVSGAGCIARRPGRAGADPRLRRPPRQRHPGRLLPRSTGAVRDLHQWPLYPGTGRHSEVGAGTAEGSP